MQLFNCPFCGPRDQSEFTYLREAAPVPAIDPASVGSVLTLVLGSLALLERRKAL